MPAIEAARAARAASGVLNLLVQDIEYLIREYAQLAPELEPYQQEAKRANVVVDLVGRQSGLQTSGVVVGIQRLESYGKWLNGACWDRAANPGQGSQGMSQALSQLKFGREGVERHLQAASVGLSKGNSQVTINLNVAKSVHDAIKGALGDRSGLEVYRFARSLARSPDAEGKITLTDDEDKRWSWKQAETIDPGSVPRNHKDVTRISENCLTKDQALQFLGPVGEDQWKHVTFHKVSGHVATGQSMQFTSGVALESLSEILKQRGQQQQYQQQQERQQQMIGVLTQPVATPQPHPQQQVPVLTLVPVPQQMLTQGNGRGRSMMPLQQLLESSGPSRGAGGSTTRPNSRRE